MFQRTAFALILLTISANTFGSEPTLYRLQLRGQPAENGTALEAEYQETVREEKYSEVEVTRKSGGSVASSMFILRGTCGLAEARQQAMFEVEPVSKQPIRLRVRFLQNVSEASGRGKVFSISECKMLGH